MKQIFKKNFFKAACLSYTMAISHTLDAHGTHTLKHAIKMVIPLAIPTVYFLTTEHMMTTFYEANKKSYPLKLEGTGAFIGSLFLGLGQMRAYALRNNDHILLLSEAGIKSFFYSVHGMKMLHVFKKDFKDMSNNLYSYVSYLTIGSILCEGMYSFYL